MNSKTRTINLTLTTLFAATLVACAPEDDSGRPNPKNKYTPPEVVEKVSANFVPGDNPRYVLVGNGVQFGAGFSGGMTQSANGAFSQFGDIVISPDAKVRNLAGTATYAIGRWEGGAFTYGPKSEVKKNDEGIHYFVYNQASALPNKTTLTCEGKFTNPTHGKEEGTATGTASLSINGIMLQASMDIKVLARGQTLPMANAELFMQTKAGLNPLNIAGRMHVGQGTDGGLVLAAPYAVTLSDRTTDFVGVAVFDCR